MIAVTLASAAARLLAWAARRAQERSTIIGLAGMLAALGYSTLGERLTSEADLIAMAAGVLSTALVAASTRPHPPELIVVPASLPIIPPTPVITKETTMSIGSELKHILGIVIGILIPGASAAATNLTTTIQNEIAKVYGEAATAMAKELSLDTTGMSGPDKVFAIVKALLATAEKDGFKGDLKILGDVCVDIAQAAYRASEPTFGSDIVALASALTANPLVTVAAELVGQVVQTAADSASSSAGVASVAQAA